MLKGKDLETKQLELVEATVAEIERRPPSFGDFRRLSLEATDELKEWATTVIRDTLQMLPEEPATLNITEKVARF